MVCVILNLCFIVNPTPKLRKVRNKYNTTVGLKQIGEVSKTEEEDEVTGDNAVKEESKEGFTGAVENSDTNKLKNKRRRMQR